MKRHLFLTITLVMFFSLAVNAFAATYYVKPNGNDTLNGRSDATAWKTIGKVNRYSFTRGDDVYFKCGGIWSTQLVVDWAGTAGDRAVVGAYYMDSGAETIGVSGNKPILDGNNLTIPTADSYSGLVRVVQSYVTVENIRCVDSGGMGFSAKGISSTNRISNVNFTNMESSDTYLHGVRYKYVSGGTIDGCDMTRCGRGWQLGYKNTWPAGINTNNSDSIIIKNNIVHENFGEGIGLYYGSADCIVENNTCYANRSGGIYIDHSKDCIIRRNLCYGTTDSTYWRGNFPSFGIGINDEDRHTMLSENNKVYHNFIAYRYIGMWIGTRAAGSIFKDTVIYNNTFVDNKKTFECDAGPYQNSYIRNNISWCISGDRKHSTSTPTQGLTWDHNNWSSTVGVPISGTGDIIGTPLLSKTTGWRSMKGGDLKVSDFALQPSSPVINKGRTLGAKFEDTPECDKSIRPTQIVLMNQNKQGSGWEIGADIYVANPTVLNPPTGLKIEPAPEQ